MSADPLRYEPGPQVPVEELIKFYSWLRDTGELDRLIETIVQEVRKDRERHDAYKHSAGLR